ncbi:MAG: phosphoenolpyruvate--protein phosphotransferase [Xanthomonadales bacterium]|nr:phosphoenolpyruvate--protein phosphotransferase [Xanthomonadales bacterium]
MAVAIYGMGVSRGVAIGRAHIARRSQFDAQERTIDPSLVDAEVNRFLAALTLAREQLSLIRRRLSTDTPVEIREFLDIHSLMLEDSSLTEGPIEIMREHHCNAEWALNVQRNRIKAIFEEMDDPYIASRVVDVDQVIHRIHQQLQAAETTDGGDGRQYQDLVLIADDVDPANLLLLHHEGIKGLVTESGGPLSHTAILARSLKIPAVMGLRNVCKLAEEGELVVLDGDMGAVMADPGTAIRRYYRERVRDARAHQAALNRIRRQPTQTLDGTHITLQANVDVSSDIDLLNANGAEGVGLYRTEYLFMNRPEEPDEDEQFEAYADIVRKLKGRPVTMRTLDLGADKRVDCRPATGSLPLNPSLGLRAIRMCLHNQDLFVPQLRAMLRASAFGPVRILIPMLSNTQELFQVRALLKAAEADVKRAGHTVGEVTLGGMIEVPAAAISARTFAKYLDFLSIGTNDLIQYTLAIDRVDDQVGYLYDPLHPAVLKLLQLTIEGAQIAGKPLSMCGEMAGDPNYTRLLLGLGLRDFSMRPGSLLEVRQVINGANLEDLRQSVRRIMRATNPNRMGALIREINQV